MLQICLLIMLAYIAFQDVRDRAIYIWCFPVLLVAFVGTRILSGILWVNMAVDAIKCLMFVVFQLIMLTIYFSIKNKRLTNIASGLLGWGDILFLFCTAFYLSFVNFIGFYLISLLLTVVLWLSWQATRKNQAYAKVPLAGFQALFLLFFILIDSQSPQISLTHDDWILSWMVK